MVTFCLSMYRAFINILLRLLGSGRWFVTHHINPQTGRIVFLFSVFHLKAASPFLGLIALITLPTLNSVWWIAGLRPTPFSDWIHVDCDKRLTRVTEVASCLEYPPGQEDDLFRCRITASLTQRRTEDLEIQPRPPARHDLNGPFINCGVQHILFFSIPSKLLFYLRAFTPASSLKKTPKRHIILRCFDHASVPSTTAAVQAGSLGHWKFVLVSLRRRSKACLLRKRRLGQ